MSFGKKPPESASDSSSGADDDEDDSSESSSQARPKQMKGEKPHPLRRWAMSKVDAIAKGFFKG